MQNYRARFPIMAIALTAMMAALWAGLLRLGFSLPSLPVASPISHGPLMVSGFLGTLIGLERSVALSLIWRSRWLYLGPILSAIGAIVLIFGVPGNFGPVLMTLGSLGLALLFVRVSRRQPALFTFVMLLGALFWVVGNILWLSGRSVPMVVWWWSGFLVITIAGERLELSRMTGVGEASRRLFGVLIVFYTAGLFITTFAYDAGVRVTGVAMVALAIWLLRHDIARRTVRQSGLARYAALSLLSGYGWLIVSGILAIRFGGVTAGLAYDAILHSLFLGFVMVMIFAHAPIIFPSVLGLPVSFRPSFYTHLILLHLSLLLRLLGDLSAWLPGRKWGASINVFVLLLFLFNTARSTRRPPKT